MTGGIEVQNDAGYMLDESRLIEAAATVIQQQDAPPNASLAIVVTSDEAVQALNRQYRDIDAPTDVLSFSAEAMPFDEAGESPYLGDLVIAYPYAASQAEREGHELADSLCLLVAHGTLHLLDYDHDTPDNRARMWAAQDRALAAMKIPLDIVPALENDEQEQPGY